MLLFGEAVEQGVHVHRHALIVWLWFVKSAIVESLSRQTKTFITAVKAHFLAEIWARPANSAKSLKNTIKNKQKQEWHDDTPTCEWVVRSVQLSGVWQTLILTRGFHASLPLSSFRITKLNLQDLCEPQFIYDFTPDCMSLFYEHQSVWAANKWTMETQKSAQSSSVCSLHSQLQPSLLFALINSAAEFEGLRWVWGSNVLLTLIFCQTSKVRLPAGACTGVLAKTRTERKREREVNHQSWEEWWSKRGSGTAEGCGSLYLLIYAWLSDGWSHLGLEPLGSLILADQYPVSFTSLSWLSRVKGWLTRISSRSWLEEKNLNIISINAQHGDGGRPGFAGWTLIFQQICFPSGTSF